MSSHKFLPKLLGVFLVILFLACRAGTPTPPTLPPTLPPPPPSPIVLPPTLPPPLTPPPPAPPTQPVQPTSQPELIKFIRTIHVTPDVNFLGGGFARINYVPAIDRLVVTFGGWLANKKPPCQDNGYSYKVYTMDLQETGESGTFACNVADSGSLMVDNTYYFVAMTREGEKIGWHILKLDAVKWKPLIDIFYQLDSPRESEGDPMVAYVNGQLDISSIYLPTGKLPDVPKGGATHHQFFSTDLQFIGKKILRDTPHINGSQMIYLDGVYSFVTADGYSGDLVVMKYDKDWKYLGAKPLIKQAHWSTGLAFDGQRFYLAYMDTSQRTEPGFFPVYLNVHLAIFDRDWNLLEDVAVTQYKPSDNMQTGRPWVILHGNRLYVSYDLDTMDPVLHKEMLNGQAIVSVYELVKGPLCLYVPLPPGRWNSTPLPMQ